MKKKYLVIIISIILSLLLLLYLRLDKNLFVNLQNNHKKYSNVIKKIINSYQLVCLRKVTNFSN